MEIGPFMVNISELIIACFFVLFVIALYFIPGHGETKDDSDKGNKDKH